MEMPDELIVWEDKERPHTYLADERLHIAGEKYHHSRVVDSIRCENEELKSKLDKAKDALVWYRDEFGGQRARTTLEEIK